MVKHPLSVKRDNYRGSDPRKRKKSSEFNRAATEIESKINELVLKQEEPVRDYLYSEIARLTNYPVEIVQKLCFSIDGGHNGFTVVRKDLDYSEAMELMRGRSSS